MSKAFESIFGGVTCLPGCFCMYRIVARKGDRIVPIFCSSNIVEMYCENVVDTLHKKNLLLLGEDRYLTTLMLRTFPKRKMVFVPQAVSFVLFFIYLILYLTFLYRSVKLLFLIHFQFFYHKEEGGSIRLCTISWSFYSSEISAVLFVSLCNLLSSWSSLVLPYFQQLFCSLYILLSYLSLLLLCPLFP